MNGVKWTPEQEQYLIENFANTNTQVLANFLGVTYNRVAAKAYKLKLKKSKEFLESAESGILVKGYKKGIAFQFPKGHIPHNKGKKMPAELYEKIKHTMFKPGQKNWKEKFDGALSFRNHDRSGIYVYMRVAKAKWRQLHQLVWEKHNGKIPPGYKVIFKDKNRLNFAIENLELVSNAELMQKNTIHRFSKELQQTIMLTSKLKREIKKQLNND